MRCVLQLLCVTFCITASLQLEYGTGDRRYNISNNLTAEHQRDILRLFRYIHQPSYYPDHIDVSSTYSIARNIDAYTKPLVVETFLKLQKQGLLQKGDIFSIFNEAHLREAITLFNLFFDARDFETLYKTAVWARNNINEGIFMYALSTALVHRPDTDTLILPPIYEIYPHYFFSGDVIQKAQDYKSVSSWREQDETFIIYSNYSGYYQNLNPEQSLSYYLEDVGLNAFYFYCNIYYPFWMDGLQKDRRGEQYYYLYQQLLARYYLERLSNGRGEIDILEYDKPLKDGYYPDLRYPNGIEFPSRPKDASLREWEVTKIIDIERRIRESIDSGYLFTTKEPTLVDLFNSDHINLLGNLIESNPESINPRYYGPWQMKTRNLVGGSQNGIPSALEHFETALRDPVFYQLYKRIILTLQQHKEYLPSYTTKELQFAGVRIEKIDFDRLITYFDYFDADLGNAVRVTREQFESVSRKIVIRQRRLNHVPFNYRISVHSDHGKEAIVRVYLGPKLDEYGRRIELNQNRLNFVEMDSFQYSLKSGLNVIERNSRQLYWYVPDRTTYVELYKRIMGAIEGPEQLELDVSEAFYGFPNRLLLPVGRQEGQLFQVYIIVTPYKKPQGAVEESHQRDFYFHRVGTGKNYLDDYAFGFPFDRVIKKGEFEVPNARFEDVMIYNRDLKDFKSAPLPSQP